MTERNRWGEEINPRSYYDLGESMATELPNDCPSLTTKYGASLMADIPNTPTGITRNQSDIRRMITNFVNFHNELPNPTDNIKKALQTLDISQPQLYDGYIDGLEQEGFIHVYRNQQAEIVKILLTEQGRVEANLFRQFFQLEEARDDPTTSEDDIEDIKEAGRDAAEARFEFWRKKVQDKNIELSDDLKRRIVVGAAIFEGRYNFLPNSHLKFFFTEEEAEKYRQLTKKPEPLSQP